MFYVSTCCIKNPNNILSVLDQYQNKDIENVELGSVHKYFDTKLLSNYDFNFMIHGYFPPPEISFNFNLASQKSSILKKSIDLVKSAIDICCNIDSSIFSFHAGIATDPPKLGVRFPREKIANRTQVLDTFFQDQLELLQRLQL